MRAVKKPVCGLSCMTPERWQRIERIYHEALEREPFEREGYIAEACRDDQDLRSEIESLVRRDNSSPDAPINRPAWLLLGETQHTRGELAPGTRLGPYEIEQPLGAGGMGEVYRGLDTRLKRPVAIKLLRAQFSHRLEREARAISALNHPHICTLYDVGADFLVMEFLEGETLAPASRKGRCPWPSHINTARRSRRRWPLPTAKVSFIATSNPLTSC